jgi:hypothetical protein
MSNAPDIQKPSTAGSRKSALSAKQAEADRAKINELARVYVPAIAKRFLPVGRVKGRYWVGRATSQDQAQMNLSVDLVNGSWRDFRAGKRGSDIQGLIAYMAKLEPLKAHLALKQMIGAE